MKEERRSMTYAEALNLHVGDCVGVAGSSEIATVISVFEMPIKLVNSSQAFSRTVEVEIEHNLLGCEPDYERFAFCFDYGDSKKNQTICSFLQKIIYEFD